MTNQLHLKRTALFLLMITAIFSLVACAPGPNTVTRDDDTATETKPAGFFKGWWHGFISLFTFIVSLFNKNVNVYEVFNSGNWYNFGFILGVAAFFGGGGGASRRWKK